MSEAAETAGSATPAGSARDEKATVRRLRDFVKDHGGSATAVVNYLGRSGARIVVVAQDGLFADAVLPSVAVATEVCERAGIPVGEWTRELTGKIDVSPADRRRMAGTGR